MTADMWSFIEHRTPEENRRAVREAAGSMGERGAKWMRVTSVNEHHEPAGEVAPHGYWVEGWLEDPKCDPPFDPPLTLDERRRLWREERSGNRLPAQGRRDAP